MELDALNLKILEQLALNARQSATDIGQAVGLSRTAVQDRIKKLEGSGVIQGYQVVLAEAEDTQVQAVLMLQFNRRPCEPALQWLKQQRPVVEVLSLSGSWDALVRVRVPTTDELSYFHDCVQASEFIEGFTSHIVLSRLCSMNAHN